MSGESTCSICLELFSLNGNDQNTPCVLSCGHTFCHLCLQSLKDYYCPTCRFPFEGFVTNFAILGILEEKSVLQKEKEQIESKHQKLSDDMQAKKQLRNKKHKERRQKQKSENIKNIPDPSVKNLPKSIVNYPHVFKFSQPESDQQGYLRQYMKQLTCNGEPHCRVCGDTSHQSKLVHINGKDDLETYLCMDCFRIQGIDQLWLSHLETSLGW